VALGDCLRKAVNAAHDALSEAIAQALAALESNDVWKKLDSADQASILQAVGLVEPAKPSVSSDEALASYLEARPLAAMRTEIDAVPGRLQQAIERAAKRLEPQVQAIALDRVTLHTRDDVAAWIQRAQATLLEAIQHGPILVK
jgi:hypothetical protein